MVAVLLDHLFNDCSVNLVSITTNYFIKGITTYG